MVGTLLELLHVRPGSVVEGGGGASGAFVLLVRSNSPGAGPPSTIRESKSTTTK